MSRRRAKEALERSHSLDPVHFTSMKVDHSDLRKLTTANLRAQRQQPSGYAAIIAHQKQKKDRRASLTEYLDKTYSKRSPARAQSLNTLLSAYSLVPEEDFEEYSGGSLPIELWEMILSYLSQDEYVNTCLVSKKWRNLTYRLWRCCKVAETAQTKLWKTNDVFLRISAREPDSIDLTSVKIRQENIRQLAAACPYLTELSLGRGLTGDGLMCLECLQISTLILEKLAENVDDLVRGIVRLTSLEKLELVALESPLKLSGFGFSSLCTLPNITALNLPLCSNITSEYITCLTPLTQLRSINLRGCKATTSDFEILSGMHNLTSLNLSSCPEVCGRVLEYLTSCCSLREMNFWGCGDFTTDHLKCLLPSSTRLRQLNIQWHSQAQGDTMCEGLAVLGKFNRLQTLDFRGSAIDDEGMWKLASSSQAGMMIYGAGLHPFSHRNFITEFRMTDCGARIKALNFQNCVALTDNGVKSLGLLTQLSVLNFEGCGDLTDQSLCTLGNLTSISHLGLEGCAQITDIGLGELSTLESLTDLVLQYCILISDEGLRALSHLTSLVNLCVEGTMSENVWDIFVSVFHTGPMDWDSWASHAEELRAGMVQPTCTNDLEMMFDQMMLTF